MESDAVQIENKPFECRFILLGALEVSVGTIIQTLAISSGLLLPRFSLEAR
jgi:hypothetical protein